MTQLSAVGVPAGAVLDSMDLTSEPSFRERGILQTMVHGERKMVMPTWPVRLADWLGLDDAAVATLRQDGIV